MRRIHVVHVIKGLGRGGAENLLPQTIRAGSDRFRYSVGYFLPGKDALTREIEAAGAPVHCFGASSAPGILASVPRLSAWLDEIRPDVVHGHLPLAGVAARAAGRLNRVPVIYTEHNLQERYHPITRRANAFTWGWQRQVVAVSREVARSIRRNLGDEVPVTIVRNGIELDRTAPPPEDVLAVRRWLDLPVGTPVIGTVAVLRAQKRLDVWLEAARLITRVRPDARFVIVGDGPLRGELEQQAARLGIDDRVRFTGLRKDVPTFLALFDVYLMSSEYEGLPLALLEAMANSLPIVTTAAGGIPEVLTDGVEGRVLPFGDAQLLARSVLDLLDDPARRATLGGAGRRRVQRRFGVDHMAARLEGLYARIAGRDHSSHRA